MPDATAPGPRTWIRTRRYDAAKRIRTARLGRRRGRPIVVLTPGKTASTAVAAGIGAATDRPVFHVHRLDPAWIADAEQRNRRAGTGALHLWESAWLADHPPMVDRPWDVVAMVREPIAQGISALFQGARRRRLAPDAAGLGARALAERPWSLLLRWFERELEPALGIDVYAHPFTPSRGWTQIDAAAVRLLVVRHEDLPRAGEALGRFLGLAPLELPRVNQTTEGAHAEAYRAVTGSLTVPPDVLDEVYGSRLCRHFYAPEEIAGFRDRWSGDT